MEPATPDIRQAIHELEEFPSLGTGSGPDDFSDSRLRKGHPLYDAIRTLLASIKDFQIDRNGDRNFPGNGGRLWYKLLRYSRKDGDHEQLLAETADSGRSCSRISGPADRQSWRNGFPGRQSVHGWATAKPWRISITSRFLMSTLTGRSCHEPLMIGRSLNRPLNG